VILRLQYELPTRSRTGSNTVEQPSSDAISRYLLSSPYKKSPKELEILEISRSGEGVRGSVTGVLYSFRSDDPLPRSGQ
jgi:hypothetical protein